MAEVGIMEAVELTGKSSATIYRWVDAGKLACIVGEDGKRKFDTAELSRVFPFVDGGSTATSGEESDKAKIVELQTLVASLQQEVDASHEREKRLQKWLDDQIEVVKQLSARSLPEGAPTPALEKKSFWARLFGR